MASELYYHHLKAYLAVEGYILPFARKFVTLQTETSQISKIYRKILLAIRTHPGILWLLVSLLRWSTGAGVGSRARKALGHSRLDARLSFKTTPCLRKNLKLKSC